MLIILPLLSGIVVTLTTTTTNMDSTNSNNLSKKQIIDSLVQLLVPRLFLASKVAAAKWLINKPIEDPIREETILAVLIEQGIQSGIQPEWTKKFFNDQFLASKMIQYELFKNWEKLREAKQELVIEQVDLVKDVRPAITVIDNQLFAWAVKNLQNCTYLDLKLITERAAAQYTLDEIHSRALDLAISNLCL